MMNLYWSVMFRKDMIDDILDGDAISFMAWILIMVAADSELFEIVAVHLHMLHLTSQMMDHSFFYIVIDLG